jgi:hemerythrin
VVTQSIEWTENLSVGILQLDNDHKKLIDLLNQIFVASYAGVGDEYARSITSELIKYTKVHFDREEEILVKHGYPACSSHKEEHKKLVASLVELEGRISKEAIDGISVELNSFLRGWLIDHILTHDLQYAAFIRGLGITA